VTGVAETLLGRFITEARQRPAGAGTAERGCELCGEPTGPGHRHLLDLQQRQLCCACRACAVLFDSSAAGGGHYRLVPDRRLCLADFVLPDDAWDSLHIPVHMAFFFHDSTAGRVVAFYPSPAGAVESLLDLATWDRIARDNPVLRELAPDVEALLVNRARGAREHWLVPVDDCYALVGLIRTGWTGFTGGTEVWAAITSFFEALRGKARVVDRAGFGSRQHGSHQHGSHRQEGTDR
jgi:hypothetical protein